MAAQVEIEDQASLTELDNGEIIDPLSSSSSSSDSTILLGEGNQEHDVITKCFLSGFVAATLTNATTTIVTIRKRSTNTITTRAKSLAFRIFTEAMARKNGGDPNVKYGWYAGSREQIERVISYGFSSREIDDDDSSHGIGIHLVPSNLSLFAAEATEEDEEGLRHLLLCRLILGKPEEIISGSRQSYPSSVEFDSGVDDVRNPRKYIIWSSTMNSYIMPTYILTFRSPRLTVVSRGGSPATPSSPRVSFAALVSTLSKSMDTLRMNLIMSTYDDFRKRKIQRDQLVRKMREVAGDNLLAQIIKNHRDKNQGQGLNRQGRERFSRVTRNMMG